METLRERMTKSMQLRRFTEGTQRDYLRSVERLAKYYDRSPDRISTEEVRDFLLHLLDEKKLQWSTVNRISAGIRFLYVEVMQRANVRHGIAMRNTLDLSAIVVLKERTHLPVIVDPSHALGVAKWITPLSKAAMACGADGVMIEVHNAPEKALCDGKQSLTYAQFDELMRELTAMAKALSPGPVGREGKPL